MNPSVFLYKFFSPMLVVLALFIFPGYCISETATSTVLPWSGYWWPLNQGGLTTGSGYRGHPAPLEKYDLLLTGRYPSTLSYWYRKNYYDPSAPNWYGHCAAWSKASISENYSILPSSENNIIFRVGDKKGLLTLGHIDDMLEKADGTAINFHLWLLTYIKDQSLPFIADLVLSSEKWFYPIYQYDMSSSIKGNTESINVKVTYATDNVIPDYIGTRSVVARYTYDLQLDSSNNIIGGDWTGDSVTDHPDLLLFPLIQDSEAPLDFIKVQDIARNQDDELENGTDLVPLLPGTHNLVLLDEDNYSIEVDPGDSFELTITKLDGSKVDLEAVLESNDGSWSMPGKIKNSNMSLTRRIVDSTHSSYIFRVSQEDYDDPNIYSVSLNQLKSYVQQIPLLPKNGMWSGFALTNFHDEPVKNVTITTHDENGEPIHTVLGPLTLDKKEKKIFLFESLPYRLHELTDTLGLMLTAEKEIAFVNLSGASIDILASQTQNYSKKQHIVIPDTVTPLERSRSLSSLIRNESFDNNDIDITVYQKDGSAIRNITHNFTGWEVLRVKNSQAPFYSLPDEGWIEVTSKNGVEVSGFTQSTTTDSLDGLFALGVSSEGQYIPHVPSPGLWETAVTLVNVSAEINHVRFHLGAAGADASRDQLVSLNPYEKRTVYVGPDFYSSPGDEYHQSIVEITADGEYAGYFTYKTLSGGDFASFPLLDNTLLRNTLHLAHYPDPDDWWTGVVISNPFSYNQKIIVEAYDASGALLEDEILQIELAPGHYEAFTVYSLFQEKAYDISFLNFRSENENELIGGLYLYGTKQGSSITGSLLN